MARSKKPRPPIDVELGQFCFTGQVEGHTETRRVLAWGGLPGEHVLVRERKRKRGTSIGVVEEIFRPSPDRVPPLEDHYICSSPWQVLNPERENEIKHDLVRDWFSQEHGIELPDFEVVGDVRVGYRNKLEFGFANTDEGVSLSFFERGGPGRRMPLESCCLGQKEINEAAQKIVKRCRAAGYESRSLKSLMLRSNQAGEVLAGLYVRDELPPPFTSLDDLEPLVGFRMYLSNPKSPASVVDRVIQDLGLAEIDEYLHGHRFSMTDRSFFQVNIPMFETALSAIRPHVLPDRPVYDLYAGVGTIGINLGVAGTHFVEIEPECTRQLELNCQRNGLEAPQIITSPAEKAIPEFCRDATLIVDPPRVGLHPKVVKALAESGPDRVIYLSCNPDTQARDLSILMSGYTLTDFQAFNFFPRTPHLETLSILDRKACTASAIEVSHGNSSDLNPQD